MIRGLYSAGTAVQLASQNQDVVAENLAQASTPGYRRMGFRFQPTAENTPVDHRGDLGGAQSGGAFTSFLPGPMQHTGNPLDLAISGTPSSPWNVRKARSIRATAASKSTPR